MTVGTSCFVGEAVRDAGVAATVGILASVLFGAAVPPAAVS